MSYKMLEEDLVEISKIVSSCKRLLEFGSGYSTYFLGENTTTEIFTIEHNLEHWLTTERHKRCHYNYCQLKNGTYDMAVIEALKIHPDIVLVDGPQGWISKESRRAPFAWAVRCESCKIIILDDINRED